MQKIQKMLWNLFFVVGVFCHVEIPASESSGNWRKGIHPDDERVCLPAPVDQICGWNIVILGGVALLMVLLSCLSSSRASTNVPVKEEAKKAAKPTKPAKKQEKKKEK